jgi:hypothetical protein
MTELSEEVSVEQIQTPKVEAVEEESNDAKSTDHGAGLEEQAPKTEVLEEESDHAKSTDHGADLEEQGAEFEATVSAASDGQWEEVKLCRHKTNGLFSSALVASCVIEEEHTTC